MTKNKNNEKSSVKNERTSQRIRFGTCKKTLYYGKLKASNDIIHRTNQFIKVLSLPFNNWVEFGKIN